MAGAALIDKNTNQNGINLVTLLEGKASTATASPVRQPDGLVRGEVDLVRFSRERRRVATSKYSICQR
jgi:hypothetical protein